MTITVITSDLAYWDFPKCNHENLIIFKECINLSVPIMIKN